MCLLSCKHRFILHHIFFARIHTFSSKALWCSNRLLSAFNTSTSLETPLWAAACRFTTVIRNDRSCRDTKHSRCSNSSCLPKKLYIYCEYTKYNLNKCHVNYVNWAYAFIVRVYFAVLWISTANMRGFFGWNLIKYKWHHHISSERTIFQLNNKWWRDQFYTSMPERENKHVIISICLLN